jgi:hypothetical protein
MNLTRSMQARSDAAILHLHGGWFNLGTAKADSPGVTMEAMRQASMALMRRSLPSQAQH